MNNFVRVYLFLRRLYRYGYYKDRPTFTLSIPRHHLPSSWWSPSTIEIYLPKSYSHPPPSTASSPPQPNNNKLPLIFDIHGGGWNVGHPVLDSQFNRYISDATTSIVIALAYRKTPYVRWPTQLHDLTALISAVLSDERITHLYDPTRVAIAGFSAGGNLATALSYQPQLKGKIQTVIGMYPALDFTMTVQAKMDTRPKHAGRDILEHMAHRFVWGYVPGGIDREDPNLSPLYMKTEDLPRNIYLVGCEYDMLNIDAKNFYAKFGKVEGVNMVYEEVKGVKHGFTHQGRERLDPKEDKRLDGITFALYDRVAAWLVKVWEGEEGKAVVKDVGSVESEPVGGELGDDIVIV
ncbi:Esterase [Arthrobotrys entomopaga]|nr:Esterase [Arthrobotrys entomopaga]